MADFFEVWDHKNKHNITEVYAKFIVRKSKDLMIRGNDFYAVWLEDENHWSTDEDDAVQLIDDALRQRTDQLKSEKPGEAIKTLYLWDGDTKQIDKWKHFIKHQMSNNYKQLDEHVVFANTETTKKDYSSKRLPYALEKGDISAWESMVSVLYAPEERLKIEWAIGAIVTGDSKDIQKFLVFYGAPKTGKSTILNVIISMFKEYCIAFDAKALGMSNSSFALEQLRTNPLVAIQHDGDLSRIEDNTRLNSLVSHEIMSVNEKFKSQYNTKFNCFLFLGTNKPVKITDAKSGLLRRLIDVSPTGDVIPRSTYYRLKKEIGFELGAIAYHCMEIYDQNKHVFDDYMPLTMLGASNDFYNFVLDNYILFKREDGTTAKAAWALYQKYCEDARVPYPYSYRPFKEELKNYFRDYKERGLNGDGDRVRSCYLGFKAEKFETEPIYVDAMQKEDDVKSWISLEVRKSLLDEQLATCPAQYAIAENKGPLNKWEDCKTVLRDLDTSKVHFVRLPEQHIVIDFDIPDENGQKNLAKNIEAASKWPETYVEVSKSGNALHLHYIYTGDVATLSDVYADHIEIKKSMGLTSLRRKLSKCNDIPVAIISSGLPLKVKKKKMVSYTIKSEEELRKKIIMGVEKRVWDFTKPSVDFIKHIVDETYERGTVSYDITDMKKLIEEFAQGSTNNKEYCLRQVRYMHWLSKDREPAEDPVLELKALPSKVTDDVLVFYDIEVYPNLFIICWKIQGEGQPVIRLINPDADEVESLLGLNLVGFNNRKYDNHIIYAGFMGCNNEELYAISQNIIKGKKDVFFAKAWGISYTDVFDFCSQKMSLKKWEWKLKLADPEKYANLKHMEMPIPWDKPVDPELWNQIAEYCSNDVIATEAVFNFNEGDFKARIILAELAHGTVNDTTNSLTTKLIFGNNKNPQNEFNYRFMGDMSVPHNNWLINQNLEFYQTDDEYTVFTNDGKPIFPGYVFENGVSKYRGEVVGEGGWNYALTGFHYNVATYDIASEHPHSIIAENLFGSYTEKFKDLVNARINIKHLSGLYKQLEREPQNEEALNKQIEEVRSVISMLFDGRLTKYLSNPAELKQLTQALKIAINSVYGLTAAKFSNPFRDQRNIDNIVAKRGALFMINLKHQVEDRGYTVVHCKTDSIKIENADKDIENFIMEYGKMYGYTFEIESKYQRMCLFDKSQYIAYTEDGKWEAKGSTFLHPYVFKTLLSHEPITFYDKGEFKEVHTALYLDKNEQLPDVSLLEKEYVKTYKSIRDGIIDPEDPAVQKKLDELKMEIDKGHFYRFIGKVGVFYPVIEGAGGGLLKSKYAEKLLPTRPLIYGSVQGTKGYRWMDFDMIQELHKEDCIDESYYRKLVDDAYEMISKFGDAEAFLAT